MLTPYERYQHALGTGEYLPDENQANVVDQLQSLYLYVEDTSWFKKNRLAPNMVYIFGVASV
jgi:predicted ATPase